MIKVKVELWMWMGKELEEDFHSPSDMRSVLEVNIEDGITARELFADLAERYKAIGEKIFDKEKGGFTQNVVVTLNDRVITPNTLYERALTNGDKLLILPIYSGG